MDGWFRTERDDIFITVRLTPKGGADVVAGPLRLSNGNTVLACRVKAPPEKGAANASLEKLMARALGVAPAQVAVVAGQKARIKTLRVTGAGKLHVRLAALADQHENGKVGT